MTRLEQLRIDRGLTPEQLGELAGVSRQTVIRIEEGLGARPSTLFKLAQALSTEDEPIRASDLRRTAVDRSAAA